MELNFEDIKYRVLNFINSLNKIEQIGYLTIIMGVILLIIGLILW